MGNPWPVGENRDDTVKIQEVIQTINQMQADGVIERYAIGVKGGPIVRRVAV